MKMKTAKDYYKNKQIGRHCGNFSENDITRILQQKATEEEKKRIVEKKMDALLGKPLYELADIKGKYCLSWNELRNLIMNF